MKFTLQYPVRGAEFTTGDGMARVVQVAEEVGFDGIAFTEHPAPSKKWLDGGGHETLDVISALSFCAAVTRRIRLMPYVLVVPYHNPFAAAKALATVDRISGGRVSVVAGTGYLRSEFLALGVDINKRNEIFTESLEVMRGLWKGTPLTHDGPHFEGRDVICVPGPVQQGGPPILIGGNGRIARRRASLNQGWSPMMVSEEVARTTKTPPITTTAQLAAHIEEVRAMADDAAELGFQVAAPQSRYMLSAGSRMEHRDFLYELEEIGVDSFVVHTGGSSPAAAEDALRGYAEEFISAPS